MMNVKKIIAIQTVALCAIVLLTSTPVHASEVTGTLNSSADPNGQIGGAVNTNGGSTVSGTITGGTGDNSLSGTVNGGGTVSGTVSGGSSGGGGGGSVGGTVSNGTGGNGLPLTNNGAVLGQSTTNPYSTNTNNTTNTTPTLPNTGFGPPDDQTSPSSNATLSNLIALGLGGLALVVYGIFEARRRQKLSQ
jgi:hypothetical protein